MTTATAVVTRNADMALAGPIGSLDAYLDRVSRIPVLANTGVNHETVAKVLGLVDGAIVGTSLKVDGDTWNPVDRDRAARMVELVAAAREGTRAA